MIYFCSRSTARDLAAELTLTLFFALSFGVVQNVWADYPMYPPQPTVIEYAVDPDWPQRPAALGPRGTVPGIAIDKHDRIWYLERGKVPVQVYRTGGELVRSWGQGQFEATHSEPSKVVHTAKLG